jgi:hypothetical protein
LNPYFEINTWTLANLTNWNIQPVDSFIGQVNHFYQLSEGELALCSIVIWAVLDPANPFIAPSSAPFVIGFVSYILESSSPPENRTNPKDTDLPTFRLMPIWSGVSQTARSPQI